MRAINMGSGQVVVSLQSEPEGDRRTSHEYWKRYGRGDDEKRFIKTLRDVGLAHASETLQQLL